jgi:hypothetical protein
MSPTFISAPVAGINCFFIIGRNLTAFETKHRDAGWTAA